MTTSVVIIDDHAVVRMGMKYLLGMFKNRYSLVGEWPQGEGAAEFVRSKNPDIVLLDIRMPDKSGIDVLKEILNDSPERKVIMLTTSEADNDVYSSLTLGAKGYLLKDRDATGICQALDAVAEGRKFVPSAIRELFVKRQMTPSITPREHEVLVHLEKGLTNETIASRMGITKDAVKLHLKNIFNKLDVTERVSAVREAVRRGFL